MTALKTIVDFVSSLLKLWAGIPEPWRIAILGVLSAFVVPLASRAESVLASVGTLPTAVAWALAALGLLYGFHRTLLYYLLKRDLDSQEVSIMHDGVKWIWRRSSDGFRGEFGTPVGIAHCPTCSTRLSFWIYSLDEVVPAQLNATWDQGEMYCSQCRKTIRPQLSSSWGEAKTLAEPILEQEVKRTLVGTKKAQTTTSRG